MCKRNFVSKPPKKPTITAKVSGWTGIGSLVTAKMLKHMKKMNKMHGGNGVQSNIITMFRNLVPYMGFFSVMKIFTSLSQLTPSVISRWASEHPKEVSDASRLLETSSARTSSNRRSHTPRHNSNTRKSDSYGSLLGNLQTTLCKLRSRHGRSLSNSARAKWRTLKQAVYRELEEKPPLDPRARMDSTYRRSRNRTPPIQITTPSTSSTPSNKGIVYAVTLRNYNNTFSPPLHISKTTFKKFRRNMISLGSACKAFITNTVDAEARVKARSVRRVIMDAVTRRRRSEPRHERFARWLNKLVVSIRKLMPIHNSTHGRESRSRNTVDKDMRAYLRTDTGRTRVSDCVCRFLNTSPNFLDAYASDVKFR